MRTLLILLIASLPSLVAGQPLVQYDTLRFYNTQDPSFNYLQLNPDGSYVFESISCFPGRIEGTWIIREEGIVIQLDEKTELIYQYEKDQISLKSHKGLRKGIFSETLLLDKPFVKHKKQR